MGGMGGWDGWGWGVGGGCGGGVGNGSGGDVKGEGGGDGVIFGWRCPTFTTELMSIFSMRGGVRSGPGSRKKSSFF